MMTTDFSAEAVLMGLGSAAVRLAAVFPAVAGQQDPGEEKLI